LTVTVHRAKPMTEMRKVEYISGFRKFICVLLGRFRVNKNYFLVISLVL